ncbi:DUF1365 domain-containing protein [Caulobacter sp. NIBR1757]|uniref:DUF1365 domain-containing protein n=1 Tax=Caulobacter sp. NIBR1757 TaxID=3016000 RepID=UPI0022F102B7|nr:DUF1365 domain-containing protein [Caulobacter sp. NIBR1757]WGM38875.1 hypothetical protein AMEJIAPC_01785 [Caulobacter sp. NIBR1757]
MTAAALYVGETWHKRFAPRPHEFRYRLFQLLVDIDQLDEAFAGLRWMQLGRQGLLSFDPRDHGDRESRQLRPWVALTLAQAGVEASAATIRLLCFPRVLGFVFNPLSVFFVHAADGRLEAVIYEVNNTFGQTHAYVIPAIGAARETQRAAKAFYVSPFYKVEGEYRFDISAPGETLDLRIVKAVAGKPDFVATQTATREPLTDQSLKALFWSIPLLTLKVVAAIHWEALRLFLKGAPFGLRPPGPQAGQSTGEPLGLAHPKNSDNIASETRSEHERDRLKRHVGVGNA